MADAFDVHYALLNAAQKKAVDHTDGPFLVLAGAGTGKTQIIALRIAKLLRDTDVAPHNILCLTFTESGVAAMRERLLTLIGQTGYQVRVATFHSFCNEIIQEHPDSFQTAAASEPLSDIERIQLLRSIIDELPAASALRPFGGPYAYLGDIARALQTLKRENISVEHYKKLVVKAAAKITEPSADAIKAEHTRFQRQQRFLTRQQELATLYVRYQERLREWQRYDYEDMLLFVVEQFKNDPDFLAEYQERYYDILVDEYQDTNGAQNEIVSLLVHTIEQPNLFVVGDDRQSIFRFQGASLENILYFKKLFDKDVRLLSLQDNYRSQEYILDAAGAVISNNTHSLAKALPTLDLKLKAARDLPRAKLQIIRVTTPAIEEYWIATTIQKLLAQNVPPKDIAVLYRNHRDAEELIDLCHKLEIPITVAAGIDVLTDPLVAQFVRVLHYVGLQGSDEELFHIMQFEFLKLPVNAVATLTYESVQKKQWLFGMCLETPNKSLRTFAERMLQWRSAAINLPLSQWFIHILNESGWLTFAMTQPNQLEHLNRMNTLFVELKRLNRFHREFSLQDMFTYIQLLQEHGIGIEEQELYTQRQAVQLMTAHRAKGLEFSHVVIMRCVDKHWGNVPDRTRLRLPPGILQFESEEELQETRNEDERRLFYVALTRARQQLYLTYSQTSESGRTTNPSQFLLELPEDVVEQVDVTTFEQEALPRLQTLLTKKKSIRAAAEDRTWCEERLKHYRLSATHYNDYLECPRKFYYEHIVHVPRATTRATGFGIAIHYALRDAAYGYNQDETLPPLAFVIQRFRHSLSQQLLSAQETKDAIHFGEKTLNEYYPFHADFLRSNRFPEHNFGPYEVRLDEVPLTGKIDYIRVVDAQQKRVHVVDYKTGSPDNKGSQLARNGPYHRQLLFYKLLVDGAKRFGFTAVSGEIHFIQKSRTHDRFITKEFEFTSEDVDAAREDVQRVYKEIMELKFLEADDRYCGECVYCKLR